ncbi:DUF6192 family protein [Streptomyces sp. NPDC101165]|uniref:DUF6192 family protein n=1 Tax=Streptomyces sp. NPDC101165 TaxID=3366119 RepID=UPI00382156DD
MGDETCDRIRERITAVRTIQHTIQYPDLAASCHTFVAALSRMDPHLRGQEAYRRRARDRPPSDRPDPRGAGDAEGAPPPVTARSRSQSGPERSRRPARRSSPW